MKYELAESILKSSMSHLGNSKMTEVITDIQIISEIKYDDYQQYTHGMRYIESLALWMRQFETDQEKDCAYDFVKKDLVYISEEEMRQLVMCSYEIAMKRYLIAKTKAFSNEKNILSVKDRKDVYRYFKRRSLFLGLSDGSHLDFFRRHNSELSNEQVCVHYDLSEEKACDMKKELKNEQIVKSINKRYNENNENFDSFFLIDDFTGSGRSYIRKDSQGWHGKIYAFYDRFLSKCIGQDDVSVHIVIYVATKRALLYIQDQVDVFSKEKHINDITVDAIQIVEPVDWNEHSDLKKLLKDNYKKYFSKVKESYVDKHFKVGGGKEPYLGFGDCSLPLVLYHNTPNNTLPIVWYSWNNLVDALFLRVARHKDT